MDISALQAYVAEQADPDEDTKGLRLLVAKLGQLAEVSIGLDSGEHTDADTKEAWGDMLAGLTVIIAHTAVENDVDLDTAVDGRISRMQEQYNQRDEMEEAMENLDFQKIAEELGLLDEDEESLEEAEETDDPTFLDGGDNKMFY